MNKQQRKQFNAAKRAAKAHKAIITREYSEACARNGFLDALLACKKAGQASLEAYYKSPTLGGAWAAARGDFSYYEDY